MSFKQLSWILCTLPAWVSSARGPRGPRDGDAQRVKKQSPSFSEQAIDFTLDSIVNGFRNALNRAFQRGCFPSPTGVCSDKPPIDSIAKTINNLVKSIACSEKAGLCFFSL